jgi:hypothetical protein
MPHLNQSAHWSGDPYFLGNDSGTRAQSIPPKQAKSRGHPQRPRLLWSEAGGTLPFRPKNPPAQRAKRHDAWDRVCLTLTSLYIGQVTHI